MAQGCGGLIMKSFDPNYINCFSKKTIKLTFQQWEYTGTAFVEIGGNCSFVDMLSDFQDGDTLLSLLKQKTSKLDFDLEDYRYILHHFEYPLTDICKEGKNRR